MLAIAKEQGTNMSMMGNSLSREPIVFEPDSNIHFDEGGCAFTLKARDYKDPQCVVILENHPSDSRVKICEDNIFQTLSSRMGTGGATDQ